MRLTNNVHDTALILEGGGMRGAFTAGIITRLLENEIYINYCIGVSAGATNLVNYLSRNIENTKKSFVGLSSDPNIGGLKSMLTGKGYFNQKYIYEKSCLKNGFLEFDYKIFFSNPARYKIPVFARDFGKTLYFSNKNVHSAKMLFEAVRASSSLPLLMKPTYVNSIAFYDGGIAAPLPINEAIRDGFKKFLIVFTRVESYQKPPVHKTTLAMLSRYPYLKKALQKRHQTYNRTVKFISDLERAGSALVLRPDEMPIKNSTIDSDKVLLVYESGLAKAQEKMADIKAFLNLG